MNHVKFGLFIAELRKSKQMTQKELAEQLHVTDKAVSKWERGASMPDIALLSSLAGILGVTISELLDGERAQPGTAAQTRDPGPVPILAGQVGNIKARSIRSQCAAGLTLLLFIGAVVCVICDLAISGALTWSLYPVSSAVFAWLVVFPVIRLGKRGLFVGMISISVFLVPFLLVLDTLIPSNHLFMPIGIRMALISVAYLWGIFAAFRLLRSRIRLAAAISLALAIPVSLCINYSLSRYIAQPQVNAWNVLGFVLVGAAAGALVYLDVRAHGKNA